VAPTSRPRTPANGSRPRAPTHPALDFDHHVADLYRIIKQADDDLTDKPDGW
jgi:hypothetical protein